LTIDAIGGTRMNASRPAIALPGGLLMPALGLGTWRMGEQPSQRAREVEALKLGMSIGLNLIDTAEMYGEGGAERVVADAIDGRRDAALLVSKLYPHNAGRRRALAACARSLQRLKTDYLDVYLLHWRGDVALAETVAAFEALRHDGRIRAWGVSNFDTGDMQELLSVPGGEHCAVNQVLYHLGCRGIEHDLLPFCRSRGIAIMAYSPLGQGRLLRHRGLIALAARLGVTPAQIALAWLLAQHGVAAIPKAAHPAHVREIRAAARTQLTPAILRELDAMFPPPSKPTPLAML
jgi:diketogulonate reductase-like aldo/keto reductase